MDDDSRLDSPTNFQPPSARLSTLSPCANHNNSILSLIAARYFPSLSAYNSARSPPPEALAVMDKSQQPSSFQQLEKVRIAIVY